MIVSFRDNETADFYDGCKKRVRWAGCAKVATRKLDMINFARALDDLRSPPGNRLEPLAGDRAGQHSIRVNDKWRVCFRWAPDGVHDVEIVDYH